MLRQLIVVVMGHVDHGKSSILDKIRGTAIVKSEAGGITQAIGASIIPLSTVKKICGPLLKALKTEFTIPGLLFIDTPGHAAFTNLRKRGGNLADIAILVVDVTEGFKPQTFESIDVLKTYKTPFIVAANKIDRISGFTSMGKPLIQTINQQGESVKPVLDKKLYEIVAKLSELGFDSERFDRVDDYSKQIAIVPTSAKTGDGMPELLMVLTGLAQKFLESSLKLEVTGPAKGTVLEVKDDKGLGTAMDVIIYDGIIKKGDTIVVGGLEKPVVTKVKALFEPAPLAEMRDKKSKFRSVESVSAATGVKISAPELEGVVAGMPLLVARENIEEAKKLVQKEVAEVITETDKNGVIVKADSLGSLEALTNLLKQSNIAIRKASIGSISKKDVKDAQSNFEEDPLKAAVLGFNVSVSPEVTELGDVKIITSNIIYKLIEDFENWFKEEKKKLEHKALTDLAMPCKIKILKGFVFRQSNPAIVGVEVLAGKLKTGTRLMKVDKPITVVKNIQEEKKNLNEAESGKKVAVSLGGVTLGRQIREGDVLYSYITENDFRNLKDMKGLIRQEEKNLLKEIAELMRKENPMWGI